MSRFWVVLVTSFLAALPLFAGEAVLLATAVTEENIDSGAYAEWVDGAEKKIEPADAKDNARLPRWVLWTEKTTPGHSGIQFGASKTPGPRHLRIGFKSAIPAGAVLARGGGQVSVLKSDTPYPGNMADESQWIPAQRIKDGKCVRDEAGRDNYVLWTLPQTVSTRALRFTHTADVTERDYTGYLGGACVLPLRAANLATQAVAIGSANEKIIGKIINEHTDHWDQWSNIPLKAGERAQLVSADSPEWVMLTWRAPVTLRGLGALYAGFKDADAQVYTGPADVHPREAPESAWQTVKSFAGLKNRHPATLCVDWLDFGKDITVRAVRLRMTQAMSEGGHPHTKGHTKDGKRVWIGELLALSSLGDADLKTALLPPPEEKEKPPIAVKFTLPESGWVTLVIEDATGKRVRNLIADTFFDKGANTVWWDGSDDLARDPAAAKHGIYHIPTQLVTPGNYRVRGLWRKQVDVKYEFGVYTSGHVPWNTADSSGGWLSNHTPPSAVLYVPDGGNGAPAILAGSYVSEGTAGLAWLDLNGKKLKGQNHVGGNWTGAPYMARDAGPQAAPDVYAYVASAWSADPDKKSPKGEIRLTALTAKGEKPVLKYNFVRPNAEMEGDAKWMSQIGGLAAHNGVVVVSLTQMNQLLFVHAKSGQALGTPELESPHGLAFDAYGHLLALSGKNLVYDSRVRVGPGIPALFLPEQVLASDLDNPQGIALDTKGNIYVSDRGQSHQVKVFSSEGKPLRAIGKPGAPKAGPYDPLRLTNPRGITIDSSGRLWVAEEDSQPKRVSVWNPDGTLAKAFYGPAQYGGGGRIDPRDKTRFYYDGMEFKLDWEKGTSELATVLYRRGPGDLKLPFRSGVPESPIYAQGRRYFTNCYNSSPTNGHGTAFLFLDNDGIAVPVAGIGRANDWDLLETALFKSIWPAETDPKAHSSSNKAAFFLWSDRNGDAQVQPDEVAMRKAVGGGVTVMDDLSFVISRLDGKATRFTPKQFTPQGVPVYDLGAGEIVVENAQGSPSSGGDQALVCADGWTIHTNAPKPFSAYGIGGAKNGAPQWSYPSLWPGLHASHEAPVPDQPGMVVGHTRLLGGIFHAGGEAMWMLNTNHGPVCVFTADGLFVAQIFQDMRVGQRWSMPIAQRGMALNNMTPSDENFWPSVTQTSDGAVYVVTGRPGCIVKVEGLESARRIEPSELTLTADDLNRAREYFARLEAARQAAQGRGVMLVEMRAQTPTGGDARPTAPVVDGKLDDWANAAWVDIDKRGTRAYFNSDSQPYNVTGAAAVAGERLYAAWRTGDEKLLKNSCDMPNAPFKTGGCLDLMIGADPAADPKRGAPAAGDVRLLITQAAGKTKAMLYRAVAKEGKDPVPFSSPWRTITFDRVLDVSAQVQLAGAQGDYEISVPLALLGLKPAPGMMIKGDIGILRGDGTVTTQRVYWSNKATAIVADVPSEAELRPNLWGRWEFKKP